MPSIVKILRAAAEPNRLRILLLLKEEELSVAELQEILIMGQSSISTHLSQLKQAGLVEDRRTGKNSLYRLSPETEGNMRSDLLAQAQREISEADADQVAMRRVVKKRQDKMRAFFDSMAGRLGKDYVPGKSWKSLAEAFLHLLPPMVIADLGAGDGSFSLLLAQAATRVIAVDSSQKMLDVAREQALRNSIKNAEFRLGDMEEVPIDDASVDLVFFSQSLHHAAHPERALREAWRILRSQGRLVILDLAKHRFEEARELYADEWLGFSESEMEAMLASAGFVEVRASVVDKDPEAPQFQTLLAVGEKNAVVPADSGRVQCTSSKKVMGSGRRVSGLSLTPRRTFRRTDVAKHHRNPRNTGHCDHEHEDHREDQEKIAHRRISLLNLSSGEPSVRPFEPQCRALRDTNPAALPLHSR